MPVGLIDIGSGTVDFELDIGLVFLSSAYVTGKVCSIGVWLDFDMLGSLEGLICVGHFFCVTGIGSGVPGGLIDIKSGTLDVGLDICLVVLV